MIKRPYQCTTAVYQLAKLRMLEFYYDFFDNYFSRQDLSCLTWTLTRLFSNEW